MRLDRFLTRLGRHTCREIKTLLADGQVTVDGVVEINNLRRITRFSHIALAGETLQQHEAIYLMLHKPAGYLSATSDPQHPTVVDLIPHPLRAELHLAGRLDRASTGLLLLTNDGKWSRRVTEPEREILKTYRVTTRDPISPATAVRFSEGIYFAYEDLTTRPAEIDILSPHHALVSIYEGRYHQVKRMFYACGNQILSLHRESIGQLLLDPLLAPGECRSLTLAEVHFFNPTDVPLARLL